MNILQKKVSNVKDSDIKSNMLLIKGACKGINDEATVNKNTSNYVGTVLTKYISKPDENNADENNENEESADESASSENENNNTDSDENSPDENSSNTIDDSIINDFISKNIISENEYGEYYVLNNDDLKKLDIDVENEENSYYIVNYTSGEVIITAGVDGKYKLSEME